MASRTLNDKRDKTIRHILKAASKTFSQVGFEGARMDEIAKHAGVNKATIYYHVGDKKALYAEVLHNIIDDALNHALRHLKDTQSPEEKLKHYIRSVTQTMDQQPYLAPIMMREQISGGQHLPEATAQAFSNIIGALTDILKEGAAQGVFIETIPFIVHSMIIGGVMFYKASGPIRSKHSNFFPETMKNLDKKLSGNVSEEIEKLILRAVRK
jgi:AcrR family transcriptional regulator